MDAQVHIEDQNVFQTFMLTDSSCPQLVTEAAHVRKRWSCILEDGSALLFSPSSRVRNGMGKDRALENLAPNSDGCSQNTLPSPGP